MGTKANIESHRQLEYELTESLLEHLRELPNLSVVEHQSNIYRAPDSDIDLLIGIQCSDQNHRIFVEIKGGNIYPKRALKSLRNLEGVDGIKMLIAPSLSEETRSILRDREVAYWDMSGSIYLKLPNGLSFVDKSPLPQPREGREPKKVFKGSTAQVIHQLLLEPQEKWKVTELAAKAKVSSYTSQKVLEYLESQLWVEKKGSGPRTFRQVIKPGEILDAWASEYEPRKYKVIKLHQYSKDGEQHVRKLGAFMSHLEDLSWGLTLEHAANLYAPLLTRLPSTLSVLVPDSVNWKKESQAKGFKVVPNGENVRLLVSKNDCPFLGRERVRNLWVASPIQVYLDLHSWPQRGKEQAQHLREARIGF